MFIDAHAAAVRRLKDELKELKKAVALERDRIEDLLVEDREWDIDTWQQRYVRHPLSGTFGRRLIWGLVDGSVTRLGHAVGGRCSRLGGRGCGRAGRQRPRSTLASDRYRRNARGRLAGGPPCGGSANRSSRHSARSTG